MPEVISMNQDQKKTETPKAEIRKAEIVVALDNLEPKQIDATVEQLKSAGIVWLKVGLELFTKLGPTLVQNLKKSNFKIFLDLKLFDIPNTVYKSICSGVDLGADLMTIHALGSSKMLEEARKASENTQTKVVAVTLLTSIDQADLFPINEIFQATQSRENVILGLAKMTAQNNLDGIVCSANELKSFDIANLGWIRSPIFVTPGIRGKDDEANDQKNISTIEGAIEYGATHLVMGRPILSHKTLTPFEAAENALKTRDSYYVGK